MPRWVNSLDQIHPPDHANHGQVVYQFWEPIIEPLLTLLRPAVIVEVGSDQGHNTRNLLDFCRSTGGTLHAIDPVPKFSVGEWRQEYGDAFVFHKRTSLDALESIGTADLVLIDGDHNWYTVFHELKTIERLSAETSTRYPVVLLHNVGWPYGRRDLYYDPDRIPEPHRHPHLRAGIQPRRGELDADGGLNDHLIHAIREGGPRNGVLTAVEDFLEETPLEIEYVQVHGSHALGMLSPTEIRLRSDAFSAFLDELTGSTPLQSLLERVEELRVDSIIGALDHKRARERAEALVAELRLTLDSTSTDLSERTNELANQALQLETRVKSIKLERDQYAAQLKRSRDEVKSYERLVVARDQQLREEIDRVNQDIDSVKSQRNEAAQQLQRLSRRRSVRLALGLAQITKPLINAWRQVSRGLTGADIGRQVSHGSPSAGRAQNERRIQRSDARSADIVVCIHNAEDDVRTCLDAIVETTNLVNHTLILVDDGSDESVQTMLREFASRYPLRAIRNEQAKGYTVAANQGIAASQNPYVVLLNSDTVVSPGWLERLIRCAETMPQAAVVGPYSNAASWQSIPSLTTADGKWQVNALPSGVTPRDVAARVEQWSPRMYPEVPLINGFCYLITRRALDEVGVLDERNFPRGYGEEDDFSARCIDAGLKLYVADDCYVYHSKSRSFTPETRDAIVVTSKEALDRKHGPNRFEELVETIRTSEDLIRSRAFVGHAIEQGYEEGNEPDFTASQPLVAWLQPHLEEAGGIRRAIEMTNRLSRWGCRTALITPDGWRTDWLPILADVISVEEARTMEFDVLIVSDPDMIWPFRELTAARKVNYHLDSYMLYRKVDETLQAYYAEADQRVAHIANSKWTAEQVQSHTDQTVEAIFPGGVDKRLFHPIRMERTHDVVCHGSARDRKSTATIEQACFDLRLLKMEQHHSKQHDLVRLINSAKVFVSASWLEGFNLSALEAMACGVPVVMTDDGGSREYAVDGENALITEPMDATALREKILRLRDEPSLRSHLIENGLQTAWTYDWDTVTAEFARFLFDRQPS